MSFLGMGSGLLGGAMGAMLGAAGDTLLGSNDMATSPIPAFYFEVLVYERADHQKAVTNVPTQNANKVDQLKGNLMSAAKGLAGLPSPGTTDEKWWTKAFIEVSGIETGLEGKKQFNEGGYNFPIDLPDKMKNTPVILKRLVRPKSWSDDDLWRPWYEHTFKAMAYWETAIKTKIVQVNIMHPNIKPDGSAYILASMDFYDAYPSKISLTALNSTSEDLMVEEIELSYSSMFSSYPK